MKITASVAKSFHQDRGPCYLHLPIFFLYMHSPFLQENKKVLVIAVFVRKFRFWEILARDMKNVSLKAYGKNRMC